MIKVLDKTFRILEYVASRRGEPVPPGEVAATLKLNHPTSVRIMRELLDAGYLEQVSRQKGYLIGHMAYWITGGERYCKELTSVADPLVKECAREVRQSVLLAVRIRNRRNILCHWNFNPALLVEVSRPFYEDLAETATGRMLLAFTPREERSGLLDSIYREEQVIARPELEKQLPAIHAAEVTCFTKPGMTIAAYPVFRNDEFTAALGVSIAAAEADPAIVKRIQKTVSDCAHRISNKISFHSSIG